MMIWRIRLVVRTSDFQSGKTGSTPVCAAKKQDTQEAVLFFCVFNLCLLAVRLF